MLQRLQLLYCLSICLSPVPVCVSDTYPYFLRVMLHDFILANVILIYIQCLIIYFMELQS